MCPRFQVRTTIDRTVLICDASEQSDAYPETNRRGQRQHSRSHFRLECPVVDRCFPDRILGRDLAWLQDVDADGNRVSDVWYDLWEITYRDVIVVDHAGQVVDVLNLTANNLADSENYDFLLNLLVSTAEAIPTADIPGDANRDGIFNSTDLVQVFQRGKYEDEVSGNSVWEDGDWDGDGDFTTGDLVTAFQAGHYVPRVQLPVEAIPAAVDDVFARANSATKGAAFVA